MGWFRKEEKKEEEKSSKENPFAVKGFLDILSAATHNGFMISFHQGPEATYTWVNNECRILLGYEPSEMIGKSSFYFINPEDFEKTYEALHWILNGEDINYINGYRMLHKDGHWVEVDTLAWNTSSGIITIRGHHIAIADEGRKSASEIMQGIMDTLAKMKDNAQQMIDRAASLKDQ